MKISKYIGETTEYDKKAALEERRPKSWLKSVSAFANGIGGALIFGVNDDDVLIGLDDARDASERISEIIKMKMDPVPQMLMEIHSENGKEFIVLKIDAGQETPYYYVGDGNRIAYVRIGNESIPADASNLKRLVLRGSNVTFDSIVSAHSQNECSFTKLRATYRLRTGSELTEADFVSFELADNAGMLTNAGVLLADEPLMRHSRLFCTRWNGLDKASGVMDALDDREYSGSLISLLENGTEFIKNNTKTRWKKTGNGRVEMPEYPEQAVHECLVNALIHRDYTELGSEVHIDIFDDRMVIYSPGGMIDGSAVQNLNTDNVASKRRNPIIADIFSRMHYMERRGSGFKKINADYRHAANYNEALAPKFASDPSSFFVTLYNLNYQVLGEKLAIGSEKVAIESEKVAIESEKVAIGPEKLAFDSEKLAFGQQLLKTDISVLTSQKILDLFAEYGYDGIFGRPDIMRKFNLAYSSAGKLLHKINEIGCIEPVTGMGKGKYRFKKIEGDSIS